MERRLTTRYSGRHSLCLLFTPNFTFKKIFLPFLFALCTLVSEAQGRIHVTGIVKDDKGAAASNASVVIKGTKTGVSTDVNGAFAIDVPGEKSVLIVTYLGFAAQELVVGQQTSFNINLTAVSNTLNDIVVVGYGTQKKVTVTGAVAVVKGSELVKSPAVNLSNSLAGRLPGVVAMNASGEPGYDGATIRIRGTNSLGNNDALIVIDGMPARTGGLDRLNPADIESMSVLKDASAAIYGARAANGVILITTKHGKTGKPELSYSYNKGWAAPTILPKMLDANEYVTMANEIEIYKLTPDLWAPAEAAFKSTGVFNYPAGSYMGTSYGAGTSTAPFSPDDIKKYKDGSDPWGHPNTDWFATVLKPWTNQSRQNLQISGGTENVKYLTSLGYENQDGQYKNSATDYRQYDMRLNLDAKVSKYISTQFGLTARQETRNFPTKPASSIFRMLMRGYPTKNAIWPNGEAAPDIENGEQPVVITTNQTGYDKDVRYYFQTNGKVEITNPWVKGLKLTINAAYDKYVKQEKYWVTPWYIYNWSGFNADGSPIMTKVQKGPTTQPTLTQTSYDQTNTLLEGILSYDHSFGNHAIIVQAGITKEQYHGAGFNAFRQYFASPAIDQLYAGGLTDQRANNDNYLPYEGARLNYFGRVGYNYKEKYIAEFLWREDGSSNFPAAHRFGFFPGITAGWRISEEDFFKRNVAFINTLKIRGSWGQLGNDNLTYNNVSHPYDYVSTYTYGTYVIGNQVQPTLYETVAANPNVTWEVANNYDLGLEGTLLNNRLSFEFDLFWNHRSKILWLRNASIPTSTGIKPPAENIGKVDNKGYEFKVGYTTNVGKVRLNFGINGGYAKNKIKFWDEVPGRPSYQQSTGHVLPTDVVYPDDMLLYQYDGVFATQKDVDANTLDYSGVGGQGKLYPGSMKFKDVNGDGKIDALDRVRSDKSRIPTFQGGITLGASYKDFDLSILFQAATGAEIFFQPETGTIGNYVQTQYDHRWTIDNPSSVDPRTVDRNNQYFSNRNTYYMLNTNYIRLKNFEIGYTLPVNLSKKAGLSRLRFYVNGLNMLTWSHTKGIFDPESTSSSGQYYPQSKVINTGLTVTF